MSFGMTEQIERHVTSRFQKWVHERTPWKSIRKSSKRYKYMKSSKARYERRKAKLNPECFPTYNRYKGWEW